MFDQYERIGAEIGALVRGKQAAYGDSFGKSGQLMRLLYPEGVKPEQLDDALAVVRVLDKLFRIATDRDAFGESPWRDVAGYALLAIARQEANRPDADSVLRRLAEAHESGTLDSATLRDLCLEAARLTRESHSG